jgi:hypothetical protein
MGPPRERGWLASGLAAGTWPTRTVAGLAAGGPGKKRNRFPVFLLFLSQNRGKGFKSEKIARGVRKIQNFPGDRLRHLEQIWLLPLCTNLNGF